MPLVQGVEFIDVPNYPFVVFFDWAIYGPENFSLTDSKSIQYTLKKLLCLTAAGNMLLLTESATTSNIACTMSTAERPDAVDIIPIF
jgi:hypothetical protein